MTGGLKVATFILAALEMLKLSLQKMVNFLVHEMHINAGRDVKFQLYVGLYEICKFHLHFLLQGGI